MRNQVVFAISAPLKRLGSSFESQTRDLMHQAYGLAIGKPLVQRELLRWMFVVLEIGHAIIELRHEQALLPIHPAYAEYQPWRIALRVMGRAWCGWSSSLMRSICSAACLQSIRPSSGCRRPMNPSPRISIRRCCAG